MRSIIEKFSDAISTLAYCSKLETTCQTPSGCAILTVSDKCEVHLLLKVNSSLMIF